MALERTLILVKPDGVQRRLIGRIVSRIEDKGLSIIGMKMLQVTPELSKQHYAEHVAKPFYKDLEAFITSGPVVPWSAYGPRSPSRARTKRRSRRATPSPSAPRTRTAVKLPGPPLRLKVTPGARSSSRTMPLIDPRLA